MAKRGGGLLRLHTRLSPRRPEFVYCPGFVSKLNQSNVDVESGSHVQGTSLYTLSRKERLRVSTGDTKGYFACQLLYDAPGSKQVDRPGDTLHALTITMGMMCLYFKVTF